MPQGGSARPAADHVLDPDGGLDGRIAAVLDARPLPGRRRNRPSSAGRTVAHTLLRPGGIPAEAIAAALGAALAAITPTRRRPTRRGQLSSHYAPQSALRSERHAPPRRDASVLRPPGPFSLSETGDLTQAAARLFDLLHRADALGRPISVAPIPDHGLGQAINDRLRRAAAPRP